MLSFSKINQHGFGTVESCPVGENTLVLAAPGFPAGRNDIFSNRVHYCLLLKK
jgi:hypothetical protein